MATARIVIGSFTSKINQEITQAVVFNIQRSFCEVFLPSAIKATSPCRWVNLLNHRQLDLTPTIIETKTTQTKDSYEPFHTKSSWTQFTTVLSRVNCIQWRFVRITTYFYFSGMCNSEWTVQWVVCIPPYQCVAWTNKCEITPWKSKDLFCRAESTWGVGFRITI